MWNLFSGALFEEFPACGFTTPCSISIRFRSQLRLNDSSSPDVVLWIIILLETSLLQLWLLNRWPRVLHMHVLVSQRIYCLFDELIWWKRSGGTKAALSCSTVSTRFFWSTTDFGFPLTRLQQLHLWLVCPEIRVQIIVGLALMFSCRLQSFSPESPAKQVTRVHHLPNGRSTVTRFSSCGVLQSVAAAAGSDKLAVDRNLFHLCSNEKWRDLVPINSDIFLKCTVCTQLFYGCVSAARYLIVYFSQWNFCTSVDRLLHTVHLNCKQGFILITAFQCKILRKPEHCHYFN